MSESHRISGDRVFCHVCSNEWDRSSGGLQCPACQSEFVEIIEHTSTSQPTSPPPIPPHPRSFSNSPPSIPSHPRSLRSPQPPLSPNPFQTHNPWAPDPDEDDITTYEFNHPGGRGTLSFTSRTYTFGGGTNIRTSRDLAADEIGRSFQTMLGGIMGMGMSPRSQAGRGGRSFEYSTNRSFGTSSNIQQPTDFMSILFGGSGQPRPPGAPPSPFELIGAMLNTAHTRRGDMVFSQEDFDTVMTQLMDQNRQSNAPGPASETAIDNLKKKAVDESMMDSEGKAECSICMDSLQLGDEVTVLPCNHWFHGDCVISWLREHDTCPHCRSPITTAQDSSRPPPSRRRRSSRRSSSVASPFNQNMESSSRYPNAIDTPSGLREARQRYYGSRGDQESQQDRSTRDRRSSDRSQPSNENDGGGGGISDWIRNRLPFSGQ